MSNPLREKSPFWVETESRFLLKICRSWVYIYIRGVPTVLESASDRRSRNQGFRLNRSKFRSIFDPLDRFFDLSDRFQSNLIDFDPSDRKNDPLDRKSNRNIDLMTLLFIIMSN